MGQQQIPNSTAGAPGMAGVPAAGMPPAPPPAAAAHGAPTAPAAYSPAAQLGPPPSSAPSTFDLQKASIKDGLSTAGSTHLGGPSFMAPAPSAGAWPGAGQPAAGMPPPVYYPTPGQTPPAGMQSAQSAPAGAYYAAPAGSQPGAFYGGQPVVVVHPPGDRDCGCGLQLTLFIVGFFIAITWYIGAFIYICGHRDPRERPGWIANVVASIVWTILVVVLIIVYAASF